ncbi:hypothetical protein TcWFU_005816 [Taenia crassiceps]|uniref:Uncharacterized protein n=1 Tax=Taenia crassiceps TaxID=6207 RepID=A0ABR4QLL7_9CEST
MEEESLYVCSCDVDANESSFSTTSSPSYSSAFGDGSSEIIEVEECALPTALTPRLTEMQRLEEPNERAKPPQKSNNFTNSDILSEKWIKKSEKIAKAGHVRTPLERIEKKLDISTVRLREITDISALTPAEVEMELYLSKGTGHRSTHEGGSCEKLNLSHPKLSSKALAFLEDAISEQLLSSDNMTSITLEQKSDKIKKEKIGVKKHSAVKKNSLFASKSEALERCKDEYHQDGKKTSSPPNQTKYTKGLNEEFANPSKKRAGLSTKACGNHVPIPSSTRATELTRDYKIIVRESSHERQRYFICLMDKKQDAVVEKLPNEKLRNNPLSNLCGNRELLNACLHSVESGKNCESDALDELHAICQGEPFAEKITTCFEKPIKEKQQANCGFPRSYQSSELLKGELQPKSSLETGFDSFGVISPMQISDRASRYSSSMGKGKTEDTTNGRLKESYCTLIEIGDDSVTFLPELPVENICVLSPDLKYFLGSRAKIQAGESRVADALKVYENPTQITECIISHEKSDAAGARGWHPSSHSIPNTENHPFEACAEFLHDLYGIYAEMTELQGVDVVAETHPLGAFESSEYLRVLQFFGNLRARSFKWSADSSKIKIHRGYAIETSISPSSNELSGLLQGGDTVKEGVIELSSENCCQNTANAPHLAEMREYTSKKSNKSQKGSECLCHYASRDSDAFGDVEDGINENGKQFTKSHHTCHVFGTSSLVDDVQAPLNDNDRDFDPNTMQVEHPKNIRFFNSTSGYTVTLADRLGESAEILEPISSVTQVPEIFKAEKHVTPTTALEFSRNLNRVCQNILIVEEEVIETADLWDKRLQTNPPIPPLSLAEKRPKPDIHANQLATDFAYATVDTSCLLNLTTATGSLVMPQNTFRKEEKIVRNKLQTTFPELVCILPLQEMPEFVNNYKLFHGAQEKPKNALKTKGIKSSSFISKNKRDKLAECTESEETNPVVVDADTSAQTAAKTLEHLDSLADYSFKLEHLTAAKNRTQYPNAKESDFLLCWRSVAPISRRKYCQLNSMKLLSKKQSKHILSHDRHVASRLKERRPLPCATCLNQSERRGGGGGGGGERTICSERVQPLVLMDGFETDSACTIATSNNEYLEHIYSTRHMRRRERLNIKKRETVSTRQQLRKDPVSITPLSTKRGPKTGHSRKNPLDLLILDTISSISDCNAIDRNGNASSDMRLLLRGDGCKRLPSIWWKVHGVSN